MHRLANAFAIRSTGPWRWALWIALVLTGSGDGAQLRAIASGHDRAP